MGRDRTFSDTIRSIIHNEPLIDVASVIGLDGKLITYSRFYPPPDQTLADRDYFAAALQMKNGEVFLSDPVRNKTNGQWTFYLSHPVIARNDRMIGVVIVGVRSTVLADVYRQMLPDNGAVVSLYKENGVALARTELADQAIGQRRRLAIPVETLSVDPVVPARVVEDYPGPQALTISPVRIIGARKLTALPAIALVAVSSATYLKDWTHAALVATVGLVVVLVSIFLSTRRGLRQIADKEATDKRDQDRRLLSAFVETPSALTAVLDSNGTVLHANRLFWSTLSGLEPDGPKVLTCPRIRGGGELLEFASLKGDHGQAGARHFELQITWENRTSFLDVFATRQFLDDIGDCVVIVGHDETERRELQASLIHSAKLVTLGEMTTGIAHEINQPLFAISMAAQNALEDLRQSESALQPSPGEEGHSRELEGLIARLAGSFRTIGTQVGRITALVQNMRVFGRADNQRALPMDVRDCCRRAVDLVGHQIRSSRIDLQLELANQDLVIVGNEGGLDHVLVNLLLNARDALSDQINPEKMVTIEAHATRSGDTIVVTVADNGPGIPEVIRDRIFEPFFTTKAVGKGMGLGLSISYGIIRDMGGNLTLLRTTKGTTFEIRLPAIKAGE